MAWDTLIGVLIGGGLTLGTHTYIQLVVVPKVDARRRREDRWEKNVLTLGDILTQELPPIAAAARSDQWRLNWTHVEFKDKPGIDPTKLESAQRDHREKASESTARFKALALSRVAWIGERIIELAPTEPPLRDFTVKLVSFRLASMTCGQYDYPDDNFDESKFEDRWKRQHEKTDDLVSAVEQLAKAPRPPATDSRRLRRLLPRRAAR